MNEYQMGCNQSNILVVDDLPDNVDLLYRILRQKGFNVTTAHSGEEALSTILTCLPDLILVDIGMPYMDGYEVCHILKANPRTKDIPIIFVTAFEQILNKVKAFEMGGVDYITKPFETAEVLARVELHLSLRRLQQQLEAQNELLRREVRDRMAIEAALQAANQELQRLAHQDGLTQIANRRCFDLCLNQEWRRLMREVQPLSLILCDVDFFKAYNDTYGHQAGDNCLRRIASAIATAVKRPSDVVARYGGEEFVLILPNTPASGALYVAQEIQEAVRALELVHAGSQISPYITLSMGVTAVIPKANLSPMSLIAAADRALYRAKLAGRDRISLEEVGFRSDHPHVLGDHPKV
ncbi:diguanylate cyclase domain-containing protein [Leptodesmis sichuanensis]|uniref:diguanylate cyclase domain-containing protein n=1 Tax=Leptodesmis sichuanensis TaxID=2906798 RepID=UPI001F171FDA|nr:diguanylate cyclase [Leptodesmis sichuanensis]UIE39193.1 diguanylate cyclase [Leptodesmis sichuanensis A121]